MITNIYKLFLVTITISINSCMTPEKLGIESASLYMRAQKKEQRCLRDVSSGLSKTDPIHKVL